MTLSKTRYNTIHQWNLRHWAKTGTCENCGATVKTQWSNKSGTYKRSKDDWQELCLACHVKHDIEVLGMKRGRKRSLTPVQELEIRQDAGQTKQTVLARRYGVDRHKIWRVLHNK